jgi:hypothetical protein
LLLFHFDLAIAAPSLFLTAADNRRGKRNIHD